jgi:hypothetical protein
MTNILYVNDKYESNELIELLDQTDITYEIRSECEAKSKGYKSLPILIVDEQVLNYKKAKRYAKERVIWNDNTIYD